MRSSLRLFVSLLLAASATLAWGQAATSLRGNVTDPSGSAIRDAQVTVVDAATSFTRTTRTGADGSYVLAELLPGTYDVTVVAKGFRKSQTRGLIVRVDLPATLNVQLTIGAIDEVISVTAEAPILNTTDASVGHTMEANAIENLPIP